MHAAMPMNTTPQQCGHVVAPRDIPNHFFRKRKRDDPGIGTRPVKTVEAQKDQEKRKYSEYAALSKAAYSYSGKAGDRDSAARVRGILDSHNEGVASRYTVDSSLSDADHVTFVDDSTGRAVVSYRGTDITNASDIFTDAAIFFGVQDHTSRFKRAVKIADRVASVYGKDNVEVTGHSLGGSQALYVSKTTGIPSYAYNPGRSLDKFGLDALHPIAGVVLDAVDSLAKKNNERSNKKARSVSTAYVTGLDPISLSQSLHPEEVKLRFKAPNQGMDVHGIDNFL